MGIRFGLRQKAARVVHAGIGLSIGAPTPVLINGRRGNGAWDRPLLVLRVGQLSIDLAQRLLRGPTLSKHSAATHAQELIPAFPRLESRWAPSRAAQLSQVGISAPISCCLRT
jgi:hypothetical protein